LGYARRIVAANHGTRVGSGIIEGNRVRSGMGAATSGVYSAQEPEGVDAPAAFAELYRLHAPFTWACLRRLGVPPALVDDAMQEVWVTAHRRLATLHAPGAAKAWLYGIARRVAAHYRRAEGRHRCKLDAWGDTAPTHAEAGRESQLIVEAILASLDERVREAFVLSELEGWTAPEIAQATGANTNTIYWRVRTARHQLQSQLAAQGRERSLDAEVIELRDATKPSRKAISHAWLVLAPQLGRAPVLGGLFASWSAAKLAIVGAGITVALATGVEVGLRPSSAAAPRAAVVATAEPSPSPSPSPAVAPSPVAVLPSTPSAVVPEDPTVPDDRAPAEVAPSPARVVVPPAPEPAPAPAVDVTADDARLLTEAKLALTEGRTADATAILAAHRDRFADSKLADLRASLELDLLCRSGDAAAARARIDAAAPGRLPASCRALGATP
jgi:RNA polymerase sigma-70 factor (ECF subfamily)